MSLIIYVRTAQILIINTCVLLKEEIANLETDSVSKWDSFYRCAEWKNIACTKIPHTKLRYILNISHRICYVIHMYCIFGKRALKYVT